MSNLKQLPLELPQRASLSGEDFLVAPANEAAIKLVDLWPNWPSHAVCVHGPSGCGKTHLAHVFQALSGAHLVNAKSLSETAARQQVNEHPALLIDDAETVVRHAGEEYLFHLLNVLVETKGSMLMLSSQPPAKWDLKLPDLASRLNALPQVGIENPDETLLSAVLLKQFYDRQLQIDADVIRFLLPRMERSFRAAHDLVAAIDRASLSEQRRITVPLVSKVLQAT